MDLKILFSFLESLLTEAFEVIRRQVVEEMSARPLALLHSCVSRAALRADRGVCQELDAGVVGDPNVTVGTSNFFCKKVLTDYVKFLIHTFSFTRRVSRN